MFDRVVSLTDRLRQEEYTGENRCIPCTAVNVILAVIVSAAIAIVSLALGVVAFVASLAAIFFRGYLVPGTPRLTKQYLPDSILERFEAVDDGDEPDEMPKLEMAEKIRYEKENRVQPDVFLVDVGAITTDDGGNPMMTDEFAELVDEHVSAVHRSGVDETDIADLFDRDLSDVNAVEDREYPAYKVKLFLRKWPASGALVTDVGTDLALRELTDRWPAVPIEQRLEILESLRLLTEVCPACDGDLEISEETVESCCRLYPVVELGCVDCGLRVTELDPEEVESKRVDWDLPGDPGVIRQV